MWVKLGLLFETPGPLPEVKYTFVRNKSDRLRLAATIPHPHCKISVLSWNEKWIIEIEAGPYKQTYKIAQESCPSLDEVKSLVTPALLSGTLNRFLTMHADFSEAFAKHSSGKS